MFYVRPFSTTLLCNLPMEDLHCYRLYCKECDVNFALLNIKFHNKYNAMSCMIVFPINKSVPTVYYI